MSGGMLLRKIDSRDFGRGGRRRGFRARGARGYGLCRRPLVCQLGRLLRRSDWEVIYSGWAGADENCET